MPALEWIGKGKKTDRRINVPCQVFKGDDRDNSDSRAKLELGRQWQAAAGPEYSYFMVFKNRNFGLDRAYTVEQFAEVLREL